MKTKVIKIGNSRGIRIPRHMLEQSGLKDEVELEVKENKIILKQSAKVREGWDYAFKRMSENKDDSLLDKDSLANQSSWDNEGWNW
jgi:antitoxin MazE